MAALTLDTTDFEVLAQLIAREMPLIPQIPPFISEAALAERWRWTCREALRSARLGNGKIHLQRERPICLPDRICGGQNVAYWFDMRPNVRAVLDVEREIEGQTGDAAVLVPPPEESNYSPPASFIYFVAAGDEAIKIGLTHNVRRRLAAMQSNNHRALRFLGSISGDRHVERELHRRFAHASHGGEWFGYSREMIEFIEALLAGASPWLR